MGALWWRRRLSEVARLLSLSREAIDRPRNMVRIGTADGAHQAVPRPHRYAERSRCRVAGGRKEGVTPSAAPSPRASPKTDLGDRRAVAQEVHRPSGKADP